MTWPSENNSYVWNILVHHLLSWSDLFPSTLFLNIYNNHLFELVWTYFMLEISSTYQLTYFGYPKYNKSKHQFLQMQCYSENISSVAISSRNNSTPHPKWCSHSGCVRHCSRGDETVLASVIVDFSASSTQMLRNHTTLEIYIYNI